MRSMLRVEQLPMWTIPAVWLLYLARAAGECVGYAGGEAVGFEDAMNRYEVRRLDYVARPV
jgi:hypothetical protein